MMTLVSRLNDEASLCRSETADDVAALLDEAADEIERLTAMIKTAPAPAGGTFRAGWYCAAHGIILSFEQRCPKCSSAEPPRDLPNIPDCVEDVPR